MAVAARRENRREILASYYQVPASSIAKLARVPHEQRKELCRPHGINPYIFRTMVDYTRYPEARRIHRKLKIFREPVEKFSVLDFGCLVADYGLYFSRLGARVAIYDKKDEAIQFARFRFAKEKRRVRAFPFPSDFNKMVKGRSLVIFGEVLEHVDNPLEILQSCVAQSVKYIFTSRYPFGDARYFALSGHSQAARAQQTACIKLLMGNYTHWILHDRAVLWQHQAEK
jgi:2-polyprenyl-3-methyl-5-hydroxy-6-metoxy-1,4-benzoquinol methylase